jgi:hypothetical protein
MMDPVTGWFHHTLYAVLLVYVLAWEKQGVFLIAGIQELPTIFLSAGHLNKPWRNDILFGSSFFLTRLLSHFVLINLIHDAWPDRIMFWVTPLLVVPLHLLWFGKFILQQVRIYKANSYREISERWADEENPGERERLIAESHSNAFTRVFAAERDNLTRITSFDSLQSAL